MKRILYFVVLFSLSLPKANSQSVKHLTLTYNEPDFSYSYDTDGCLAIDSEALPFVLGEDTLAPALPYFPLYVLINPELDYASASVTSQDSVVFTNVNIAPNPLPLPTSLNTTEMVRGEVSYTDSIYPDENVEYRGTQTIAGYKVLSFLVSPYKYLSQNRQLRFVKSLDVDINLVPMSPTQEMPTRIGNAMRDFVESLVVNKEEMDSLYPTSPQAHGHGLLAPPLGDNAKYRYVIITDSSLVEAYRPLAKWKTTKGVRTKIVTTQDIYSRQSGNTPQLQIKKELRDLYEEGLEYALLGGNVDLVPTQMCYPSWHPGETISTPADLYYSCFNKSFNWDANNNGICGESDDSVDITPYIYVTRIPLSKSTDVEMFVKRILNYERDMDIEPFAWKNRILLSANKNTTYGDYQERSDKIYNWGILPYQHYSRFRFYDSYTDYPEGALYPLSGDNLQEEIEKGYAFVNYCGHGYIHAWGHLEDSTLYYYRHAGNLNNPTLTVVTTTCCHSNAFDIMREGNQIYDDHNKFSIALIKNPNSGVVSYYGCSREGLTYYTYSYLISFYKHLFNGSSFNYGKVAQLSKSELSSSAISGANHSFYWWLQLTINPIGDPEMPLRTSTPQFFDSVNITIDGDHIRVNTNVDSCIICVMSANDNGLTFYDADTLRQKSYPFAADTMSICITKDNYIPVVYKYVKGGNLYIQNETMHGNNRIHGGYIMVGSNVTTEKEAGPVVIEDGATTIESTNGVTITRDFEVKEGAELEIKISN